MRPIAHTRDKAVLQWIDLAIFDMACVIDFVADQVLPEAALPDAALVASATNGTAPFVFGSVFPKRLSVSRQRVEKSLSLAEAQDRMQVIRQYHECVDVEAVGLLYRSRKSAI